MSSTPDYKPGDLLLVKGRLLTREADWHQNRGPFLLADDMILILETKFFGFEALTVHGVVYVQQHHVFTKTVKNCSFDGNPV